MPKFIEGIADKLQVPAGARDVQLFDTELPGFGIRKFAKGHASYFVKYNVGRQQRRKTLGKVLRGNLKAMRLEASAILAKARLGTDVVAVARAAAAKNTATLGDLVPKYLTARAAGDDSFKRLRDKTLTEITRYLTVAWQPLHSMPVDAVSHRDVASVVDDLARNRGKTTADRARMALSGLLAWAIERRYLDANPSLNVRQRAQGGARERVLSEAEMSAVWRATLDDDYGRIVRLLILTGQRRAEVGGLGWSEIDLERRQIDLPAGRTKNNRANVVPLSDQALRILEATPRKDGRHFVFGRGTAGFADWSKRKAELDARITKAQGMIGPWVLHDLRRSVVTHISERGLAQPHVVEAIVNHISGTKAGVAGVYNRATYIVEKRQALELWGEHVAVLVASGESKAPPTQGQRVSTEKLSQATSHALSGTPA